MWKFLDFSALKGQTLTKIENHDNEELVFTTQEGNTYRLYHEQDCCESVYLEDIAGNLDDLIGTPLLMAEEVSNAEAPDPPALDEYDESCTWTFYKLATVKGYVTLRWYGTSNGYYSESVSFVEL